MKIVKNEIEISASKAAVWDALVNSEKTKIYMFGCEAITDWNVGSPLLWLGNSEGQPVVFVKGFILDIKPDSFLQYTVFDPNADMPDIPENHLRVTYELRELENATLLTVTQDGFELAADGEKRYEEVYNNGDGWNPILKEIKKLVEIA